MPAQRNAVIDVSYLDIASDKLEEVVEDYKLLDEKCDKVIDKIKKRKAKKSKNARKI